MSYQPSQMGDGNITDRIKHLETKLLPGSELTKNQRKAYRKKLKKLKDKTKVEEEQVKEPPIDTFDTSIKVLAEEKANQPKNTNINFKTYVFL